MVPELDRNVVVERAFWAAAGLAAIGGVLPLLLAIGHTNRIAAVFLPFAAATAAMAGLALFYRHGRALATLVYFAGGLAITYGLLLALAVPMRLAVEGSCPPAPQRCTSGLEMQLSNVEGTGVTIAVAFGLMALFAGFVGLAIIYRQKPAPPPPAVWPDKPPPKPEAAPVPEATEPAPKSPPE